MNNKKDYHEYVFNDGKLIGKFEEMYRYSKNTPWHQDEIENFPDISISKTILNIKSPYDSVLEIGCGLGYYLNEIEGMCKNKEKIWGADISNTAIEKAGKLFPHLKFSGADISTESYVDLLTKMGGGQI